MQKKVLVLAIAGALGAPLAAQGDGSSVQIYGLMQPSVDHIDNGQETGTSMQNNKSRLGFRGAEDLGNNLKAIFQLESAVDFDNGSGAGWTGRDSWAGLSSRTFGTLVAGTKFTAYKTSTNFVDVLEDTIGDYNNVVGVFKAGSAGYDDRARNSLSYVSPSFSGFQVSGTYGLETNGGKAFESQGDNTIKSVAATYKTGALTVAAAYEAQQRRIGFSDDGKAFKVGAGYQFGKTLITGMYAREDFGDDPIDSSVGCPGGGKKLRGNSSERDLIYIALRHSIGDFDLLGAYTWADDFDDYKKSGVKAYAVGAAYNFSKRTSVNLTYALVDNDHNAAFGMDAGYKPAKPGERVKGISARVKHAF